MSADLNSFRPFYGHRGCLPRESTAINGYNEGGKKPKISVRGTTSLPKSLDPNVLSENLPLYPRSFDDTQQEKGSLHDTTAQCCPLPFPTCKPQPLSLYFLELPSRLAQMLSEANDPTNENSRINRDLTKQDPEYSPRISLDSGETFSTSDTSAARLPCVRKKSGQLVKPSLKDLGHARAKSLPTSPTCKQVHFGCRDVCYFKKKDRPAAISASDPPGSLFFFQDSSDGDTLDEATDLAPVPRWTIKSDNLPHSLMRQHTRLQPAVFLQDIFVLRQKTVVGHIAVKNIAYEKSVLVRYSLDSWQTIIEQTAFYTSKSEEWLRQQGYDRFTFQVDADKMFDSLSLSIHTEYMQREPQARAFELCIRYTANRQEFWDNNGSNNYHITLIRRAVEVPERSGMQRNQCSRWLD